MGKPSNKNNLLDGFTKKYNVHNLMYFEQYTDSYNAIQREKRIKIALLFYGSSLEKSTHPIYYR
ncbi:MAG TPA: hypothetical protein DF296_12970 [Candidatus Margulisbacteria bacterium]|nr:MAG: hypothetical protein A2X43_02080 [Candidatus Margulisbacteria bacterium GWD2_39_127]OGI00864.1 MAG: hypothetical protein A2X42_02955 [Candidatus Margulisbacteria bacterium GWF2_38_17]OGI08719.1 MAG: hypothetical protein A2X41_05210 [Candidatus Margulisbacteria bacterium GWE2_39_32]HAR63518.1 hypothetical protein [Candidatus Margulisiibacteriota bacterium]HCT86096.1 hypothetical protein [Candidatus Margulisiibacteriota bacterium]